MKIYLLLFSLVVLSGLLLPVQGQTKLYFDKDGRLSFIEKEEGKKSIAFYLEESPEYTYGISTRESNNFWQAGNGPFQDIKLFNGGNAEVQSQGKDFFFYQLYRFPKELKAEETTSIDSLKSKAKILLTKQKDGLTSWLDKLTVEDFKKLDSLMRQHDSLSFRADSLNRLLSFVERNPDSLSLNDLLNYKKHLSTKNILQAQIGSYNNYLKEVQSLSKDTLIVAEVKIVVNEISGLRKELLKVIDSIGHYRFKKSIYVKELKGKINKELAQVERNLLQLPKDHGFKSYMDSVANLNKVHRYDFQPIYSGYISRDEDIKAISYNYKYNHKTQNAVIQNITPFFPVLTEHDYLSIVIRNVPDSAIIEEGVPLELNVETGLATYEVSRFAGVRPTFDVASQLQHLWGEPVSNFQKSKKDNNQKGKPADFGLELTMEYFAKNPAIAEAQKDSIPEINSLIEKYQELSALIQTYGEIEFTAQPLAKFRDYTLNYGNRFNHMDIPVIKVNAYTYKSNPDKSEVEVTKRVLVSDSLKYVQRTYRIGVSTGVLMSVLPEYSYHTRVIQGTDNEELIEDKTYKPSVQPNIFFSVYPFEAQNIDNPSNIRSSSINIGIDIDDFRLLDNAYVGIGFEPTRHFMLSAGVAFGKVKVLNRDSYDGFTLEYNEHLENKWVTGGYFAANFYLNIIPKVFSQLF